MSITRAVTSPGKLVCTFGTGLWSAASGTAVQGYTGMDVNGNRTGLVSRTGMQEMLAFTPDADAGVTLSLATPATNLRTTALAGSFVLVCYVDKQPGFQPGGTVQSNIQMTLTTNVGLAYTNALFVNFGENQIREGWNFLRFKMRNPLAYQTGTGAVEYHPNGVTVSSLGDGTSSDILNSPLATLKITLANLGGATVYFDSLRTGITSTAEVVLGCDLQTSNVTTYSLPLLVAKGWKGYFAAPGRIWAGGDTVLTDLAVDFAVGRVLYSAGWDAINHTVNHFPGTQGSPNMSTLTNPALIDYEVSQMRAVYAANGLVRGQEFYASPQLRTSRLAQATIRKAGIVLQRHGKKMNTTVTPWGVDNPHNLGGTDIGLNSGGAVTSITAGVNGTISGANVYTKIKRMIDVIEAYGDTWLPFWHSVTTLGDSGTGEDVTGDDLLITRSALSKTLDYLAEREAAGGLRVRDGLTGWFYGVGR